MSDKLLFKANGAIHSWASCSLLIGFTPFIGITEINWKDKRTRSKVLGMDRSSVPLGMTHGVYEADPLTFKMLVASFNVLQGILTTKGLGSAGNAVVDMTLKLYEPKLPPVVVVFSGCRISERAGSATQGSPDPIYRDLAFDVASITENGMAIYSRGPL